MIDLRIIIVTWNNRSTIERCLSSLTDACVGISYDVVVVDNASADETVVEIGKWKSENSHSVVIANKINRGFAAACNQGLVDFGARYVALLNPDAVCPKDSLAALVREADARPKAGILGPKLLNVDGSVQASVRRFPGFLDQLGILLKLHTVLPNLPMFRRYFAKDVPLDCEASVDQVMGACFLIRREVIETIGGLDERYFVWFEEVDYCRMAKRAGWDIAYVPSVSVEHGGGHSFAQTFVVRKQRLFNASLVAYAEKWWGCGAAGVLRAVAPISILLAKTAEIAGMAGRGSRKVLESSSHQVIESSSHRVKFQIFGWLAVILGLEIVSALTIFHDAANTAALMALTTVVAWISWRRPALGLAALALELVIGSKGALLQVGGWPGTSLRICLFVAFFIGWLGHALSGPRGREVAGSRVHIPRDLATSYPRALVLLRLIAARWEWLLLFAAITYGVVRGMALRQPFFAADANAWGFALLALPVLDIAAHESAALRRYVPSAIIAGLLWIAVKALALEYVFSHGFAAIASDAYLWVRRTGVAEVTLITANAFRIFMQSQIWAVVGLLSAIGYRLSAIGQATEFPAKSQPIRLGLWPRLGPRAKSRPIDFLISSIFIASVISLALSLSRSIWMGTAAGVIALLIAMWRSLSFRALLRIARDGVIALAIVFAVIAFPVPRVDYASLKTLFGSRLSTSDAAAASRWNLFPVLTAKIKEAPILGHGFGATVTYASKDPRIVAQGKGGVMTTYAFEWGWLEHWIKMGVLGVIAMVLLLVGIGRRAWTSQNDLWLRAAAISVLIAIAVTNFFTPYLNHPLGFGILLLIEGLSISTVGRSGKFRLKAES